MRASSQTGSQIGKQVTQLVDRIGKCQILFAYILGWLKDEKTYAHVVAKLDDVTELRLIKERFDNLSAPEKRLIQSAAFYFTLMGSQSHDVFYALTGKKGDKWGSIFTELRTKQEGYLGGWYYKREKVSGKEVEVLTYKQGLLSKLTDEQVTLPESHPINPLYFKAVEQTELLDLAEFYFAFLEKKDESGLRPTPFFREMLEYLTKDLADNMQAKLLKLFVNAIAYKNLGHFKLHETKMTEAWALTKEEWELKNYQFLVIELEKKITSDPAFPHINVKEKDLSEELRKQVRNLKKFMREAELLRKRGEEYVSYLEFRKEHHEFIKELADLGRDGWRLHTSQKIRDWCDDKTTDEEIRALSREAISKLPFVMWFAVNHAQHSKFKKGVTYPKFTPAAKESQSAEEQGDNEDHEHHFSWPAQNGKAKGLYQIIQAPTQKTGKGIVRLDLPFGGTEDIEFFAPKDQWQVFKKEDPRYAFRTQQGQYSKSYNLPTRPRGLKIMPLDDGGLELHLAVDVYTPEKDRIWDKNAKAWILPEGMVLSGVSILPNGSLWGVRGRVDQNAPHGVKILYSGAIGFNLSSSDFGKKIQCAENGTARDITPRELKPLLGIVGENINNFHQSNLSKGDFLRLLESALPKNCFLDDQAFQELIDLFWFQRRRAEGTLPLANNEQTGGIETLLNLDQRISKKRAEYLKLKERKNLLRAEQNSALRKKIRILSNKQTKARRELLELRELNRHMRQSRVRNLANTIAQFGLGLIKKEGQQVSQSSIVFLPETEPKDKPKARSKHRADPILNTIRTLRAEGKLSDKANEHFDLLGINTLRGQTSRTDLICPKCKHQLVPYSVENSTVSFDQNARRALRSRKLCCTNQHCEAVGLDQGHVSALNMILSFNHGSNFKVEGNLSVSEAQESARKKLAPH